MSTTSNLESLKRYFFKNEKVTYEERLTYSSFDEAVEVARFLDLSLPNVEKFDFVSVKNDGNLNIEVDGVLYTDVLIEVNGNKFTIKCLTLASYNDYESFISTNLREGEYTEQEIPQALVKSATKLEEKLDNTLGYKSDLKKSLGTLFSEGEVIIGYRQCCGGVSNSHKIYKEWMKLVKQAKKFIPVEEESLKVTNRNPTSAGGFWEVCKYKII